MNNLLTYKKIIIIGCLVAIVLGLLLHSAYEFFGNNSLLGMLVPVNESVWEHLKLIFLPFTLFCIFFYFYTKRKYSNTLLVTLFGNVLGMFVTVVLYYFGANILKTDSMIYNIIVYIIGIISSFYLFYLGIYNKDFLEETKGSTILGVCALTLLFAIFVIGTYYPLKLDITKDPITKTYGIYTKT